MLLEKLAKRESNLSHTPEDLNIGNCQWTRLGNLILDVANFQNTVDSHYKDMKVWRAQISV